MNKNKLWSDTINSYSTFLKFDTHTAKRMRELLRKRFPAQSSVFDSMDREALK